MPDRLHLIYVPSREEVAIARNVVMHPQSYQAGNTADELADMIRWAWSTLRIDLDIRRGRIVPLHSPGDAA